MRCPVFGCLGPAPEYAAYEQGERLLPDERFRRGSRHGIDPYATTGDCGLGYLAFRYSICGRD